MISSDIMRGYNDIIILSILNKDDSYGYAINKKISDTTEKKYIIKETTLYSAFVRLEQNNYITSYKGKETNGKERNYYKITNEGKKYLEEKCQEWKITKEVINQFTKGEF